MAEETIRIYNVIPHMTYKAYEQFVSLHDTFTFRADEYCPSIEEIDSILTKDWLKYTPFMLWVLYTGFDTKENIENRKHLRRMLYKLELEKTHREEA